ncbi:MAG: ornithine carbamoyltransferase [Gemmatimonadales bacterium]|nr:MAG: ornithine carbamoyltransferase [Gemmatimonadales bacterium]
MTASPRHFLEIPDLDSGELRGLLARAARLKAGEEGTDRPLAGTTLALIFRKSSTRTRVSFEVGIQQLGGAGIFLSDRDTQLGRGEPIMDTSRVLSGYVDGIMIRTFQHAEVEELARWAAVPVINGLTDRFHPCQLLADLMTLREEFGTDLSKLRVAWVGDGNNMAHSWLNAAYRLGFELRLAVPEGFDPDPELVRRAASAAPVHLVRDPREAVEGAHAVNTDVWASMGQEGESEARSDALRRYQVDAKLMALAAPEAIFLHCLPAHRGEEVSAEVIDGPQSRIYREAENRLHAQKALLLELLT